MPMPYRRRIWCEMLPCEALVEPRVLGLLRRFEVAPIIAVWPSTDVAVVARSMQALEGEGLRAAIWPMLADRDGRWANAENAGAFSGFVGALSRALAAAGQAPSEVLVDLEPSIQAMRASLANDDGVARTALHARFLAIARDRRAFLAAKEGLRALGDALRGGGALVSAVVPPTALFDPATAEARPFQEILGTPVDGLAWDHVSVMLYSSILEGWSRGALRREDARAYLGVAAADAALRYGARAGVSLGAVGVGAFGNEPVYRSPRELADDVAITRAAGVDDLTLFDLGGVLRREAPEAWLEAFTATPKAASTPAPTLRLRGLLAGTQVASVALRALGRVGK
uniref:Uncharacterized protein n=1 Tax=Byssovorax cruenta TaxID=293647 RepID=A0A3S7UZ80_9BACT|nr:hypothetical protein [Byssovorax cruenta]